MRCVRRDDCGEYLSETSCACDVTSDWDASCGYFGGGAECDRCVDSLGATETRKRFECNVTHDEDNLMGSELFPQIDVERKAGVKASVRPDGNLWGLMEAGLYLFFSDSSDPVSQDSRIL